MMRLLLSAGPSPACPPVFQASEKLPKCGGHGNESGVWYVCSVVSSAIATRR